MISVMQIFAVLWLALIFEGVSSFLWYSPITKGQTLEDCLIMRETKSPFYPSYCDRLLLKYNYGVHHQMTTPTAIMTIGWGWSSWTSWAEGGCPDVCGRRCRVRRRSCAGDFKTACAKRGKAYEFDDCPALAEEENDVDNVNDVDYEEDNDSVDGGGVDDDESTFQRLPSTPANVETLNFMMRFKEPKPTRRRRLRARKRPKKLNSRESLRNKQG